MLHVVSDGTMHSRFSYTSSRHLRREIGAKGLKVFRMIDDTTYTRVG